MKTQILKYLQIAFENEAEQGTALTADDTPTDDQGSENGAAAKESDDKPDDQEAKGEADDKAEGDDKGDDKPADPDPIEITAPEGFENYSDDFKAFSDDMQGWMEKNPEASVKDALQEAARRQADLVQQQQQKAADDWQKTTDGWLKEAKSDPDIGGDDFMQNAAIGRRALDAFGDDELKTILEQSGLGNHRAVIKFFKNAGSQLKESGIPKPGQTGQGKSHNERLTAALYGAD